MHAKKQNKFLSFALLLNHPDIEAEILDNTRVCTFLLFPLFPLIFLFINIYMIIRLQLLTKVTIFDIISMDLCYLLQKLNQSLEYYK